MRPALTVQRIGDDVLELAVASPQEARALATTLADHPLAQEIVPALDRVAVRIDLKDADAAAAWLEHLVLPEAKAESEPAPHIIELVYGGEAGPDFDAVCDALSMSASDFIDLHTSSTHRVEMIGFTPGFAYVSGLPEEIQVPRLSQPRARVPAGSVGLSAAFTGIYALAGPGGWPLIGKTYAPLFEADRDPAFLLSPGQPVQFRAV
ncbi:MAG: 5-oxoprolinase subunit PxpB [Pseudomonadota bacterium]